MLTYPWPRLYGSVDNSTTAGTRPADSESQFLLAMNLMKLSVLVAEVWCSIATAIDVIMLLHRRFSCMGNPSVPSR